MKRFLYSLLVRSHPRRFREQFGDEMISIFDEVAPESSTALIADGVLSLLRQRIVRSNLWKMACGAAISAVVICAWASAVRYAMEPSVELVMNQAMKLQWAAPSAESRIDMDEFRRETATAIAILADSRRENEQKRRSHNHSLPAPLAPSAEPRT